MFNFKSYAKSIQTNSSFHESSVNECTDMGRFTKLLVCAVVSMTLIACQNASEHKTKSLSQNTGSDTDITKSTVTRDQCMAQVTKAEKIECMKKLKIQREAEIAIKTAKRKKKKTEISALNDEIRRKKQTVAVLTEIKKEIQEDQKVSETNSKNDDFDDLFAAEDANIDAKTDKRIAADKAEIKASLKRMSELLASKAKITRDQCMALATKVDKIECMKELKVQRQVELDRKILELKGVRAEGERLDETIKGLERVVDIQEEQKK